LVRKLAEAYYTLLIEIFWSKERILEVYLNTVDWGPGIMGAEAASRVYFQRPSSRITLHQAALLAAILPSPHRWSPTNPNKRVRERQKRIMKDMAKMPVLQKSAAHKVSQTEHSLTSRSTESDSGVKGASLSWAKILP
jgi:monofunctional biosynthetic peptidoglycan transglycosylase